MNKRLRLRPRPSVSALLLCSLALVLAILTVPPRPAEAQLAAARRPSPYSAWLQVEEFTVTYESSFNGSFSIPWDWHGSVHDYTVNQSGRATGKIKRFGNWSWEGNLKFEGTHSLDEHWYTPEKTLGNTHERAEGKDYQGSGLFFRLEINPETGRYSVIIFETMGINGTIEWVDEDGSFTRDDLCYVLCPGPQNLPLPSDRPPLSFSEKIAVNSTTAGIAWRLADPYSPEIDVHFTIAPVGPKPEFLLKPVSPRWMPEPDAAIKAAVVPKRKNQAPAPVRFVLEEITREPGTCLNSPETDTAPDLEFDPLGSPTAFDEPELVGEASYVMQTEDPVTAATALVRARDYGAWGKLRAEAYVDGGWKPIPVEGSRLGYLTLPYDRNENKISDQWEKKNKAKGKPATWDEETQPRLDGVPGDGLSLYEEYRGLRVKGKHTRLSPKLKELVVENQIGAQADPGIKLLGAASKLKVYAVNTGELPVSRQVNANSSLARTRDQYGLRLKDVRLAEGTLGGALPLEKTNKRPKDCTEVQVDVTQILASPPGYNAQAELENTIAHELGHGIGASHHGEAGAPLIDRFLTDRHQPPAHIVYGSDGKVIPDRPFRIQGLLGGLGSLASGDEGCIMCYNSYYQWAVQRTAQGEYRYYAQQYRLPGRRFCTSAAGTGVNDKKHRPAPYFGNAERGNCLAQLGPKDR
ncbi:MAG: hypothetical protein ACK47B_08285 [Armatimonadota bacterium]